MKLRDFIDPTRICIIRGRNTRDSLLRCLSERAAEAEPGIASAALFEALLERERKGATAMPEGVAIPHALLDSVQRNMVFVARLEGAVDFQAERGGPVDLVFLLVGPTDSPWEHIRILARIARICHAPGALERFREAGDEAMLYRRLVEEDKRHV